MSVHRRKKKQNILQSQTQKKNNTTTRDKNMTILIGLLRFGEKNTTTLYSSFICAI